MSDVAALAATLDEAVRRATAIPQLSADTPLTLAEAYAVQAAGIGLRGTRGDSVVGVKLGFTSKAKAVQMGVSDVIIGVLTESMAIDDAGTADLSRMIHPRIEPEVAFRLGADIDPADDSLDPVAAVSAVAPALEIIDSRYRDFSFSLEDVVADNTSAAGFVIGPWQPFPGAALADLAVTLTVDGAAAASGSTTDILGDPIQALAAVKRMALEHHLTLPAGSIILAGAATAAVPLTPGAAIAASVAGLGSVSVTASGGAGHREAGHGGAEHG